LASAQSAALPLLWNGSTVGWVFFFFALLFFRRPKPRGTLPFPWTRSPALYSFYSDLLTDLPMLVPVLSDFFSGFVAWGRVVTHIFHVSCRRSCRPLRSPVFFPAFNYAGPNFLFLQSDFVSPACLVCGPSCVIFSSSESRFVYLCSQGVPPSLLFKLPHFFASAV